MSGRWQVWRDGTPVSPIFDRESDAFGFVLRAQPQSVAWALRYGGWRIVPVEEPPNVASS